MQYHENLEGTVSRGTGGKKVKHHDKKKAHVGSPPTMTRLGDKEVRKKKRGMGGGKKVKAKVVAYANVEVEKGKFKKVAIQSVLESNNPDYTRRNIIVKGAIIQTEIGKAVVTSRPGQDGVVNAKLLSS